MNKIFEHRQIIHLLLFLVGVIVWLCSIILLKEPSAALGILAGFQLLFFQLIISLWGCSNKNEKGNVILIAINVIIMVLSLNIVIPLII